MKQAIFRYPLFNIFLNFIFDQFVLHLIFLYKRYSLCLIYSGFYDIFLCLDLVRDRNSKIFENNVRKQSLPWTRETSRSSQEFQRVQRSVELSCGIEHESFDQM